MEINDYEQTRKQQTYPKQDENKIEKNLSWMTKIKEKYQDAWNKKDKLKHKPWLKPGILLVFGIFLMYLSGILADQSGGSPKNNLQQDWEQSSQLQENLPDYMEIEQQLEAKLEKTIQQVAGVNNVLVSVTLDSSLEKDYAIDSATVSKTQQESDTGGTRKTIEEQTMDQQLVLEKGGATPIVIKESMPKVRGVAVVATGVENPMIRETVFNIVQGLLDVPAHRIVISNGKE